MKILVTRRTLDTHHGPLTFYRVATPGYPAYNFTHAPQALRRAWLLNKLTGRKVEDRTK